MSDLTFWASAAKLILALPVVVLLAYLSLRLTASVSERSGKGHNIEIVEKKVLHKNQFLYIVKAGQSFHLMAGTEHSMTLIRTLDPQEVKTPEIKPLDADKFKGILTAAVSKLGRSA